MMWRLARPYAIAGWLAALVGAVGAIALRNALAGLSAAVTFSAVAGGPAGAATGGNVDRGRRTDAQRGLAAEGRCSMNEQRRRTGLVAVAAIAATGVALSITARLRGDIDLSTVSAEIVETASTAVRPTTAGVWLRELSR